jgi:hypothetical protein
MALKNRKTVSYIFLDVLLPWGGFFLIHFLVKNVLQEGIYELFATIVIPVVLCLIRAEATNRILEREQIDLLPKTKLVLFQLSLALALIVLMVFEVGATMLTFAKDAPKIAWLICISLYFLYLFLMFLCEKIYHNNSKENISETPNTDIKNLHEHMKKDRNRISLA